SIRYGIWNASISTTLAVSEIVATLSWYKVDACRSDVVIKLDYVSIKQESLNFGVAFKFVTDFNEIVNHFFERMYVHLCNTNLKGGMTTQPQAENSNFGNPTKGYGYQTNLTNQFLGQYITVDKQTCGVSSRVFTHLEVGLYLTICSLVDLF
ncbi:hypothetical protein Golax_017899, partial [Gossypium laxum]|nr:hypothetical protein [Gossypium laxum]